MRAVITLLGFIFLKGVSFSQSYKTFDSDYFEIGDSIRAQIEIVGGPYYREWNIQGADKDRLVGFLEKNPRLSIGINVYSDTRGTDKKNLETTEIVAQSYIEWLTKDEGFSVSRFTGKGWGEHKPIISEEQQVTKYSDANRSTWDSIHRINERVILVIEDVAQNMDCAYRTTDNEELLRYYQLEEDGMLNLGDRFRLDFVKFKPNSTELLHFEQERDKYASLAAFVLCHPGVKFQLSVHSQAMEAQIGARLSTERAMVLMNKLISTFSVSNTRISAKGFEDRRPLIPKIILDELANDPKKQNELRSLNDRTELEIVGIGAFNDAVRSNQLRISDAETTRDVLYREYTHQLTVLAYFDYDSIQPIASNNDLSWSISKTAPKSWLLKLSVNASAPDVVHLSFLGWSKGKSKFIYTHAYNVFTLGDPSVYIGTQKISDTDLSVLREEDLFTLPDFYVKYDTSIYFLLKSYTVDKIFIQVGSHKYTVKGSKHSKRVMKAIRDAKFETNIWFAAVGFGNNGLMIERGFDKKSGRRRAHFYPDYIGRNRIR